MAHHHDHHHHHHDEGESREPLRFSDPGAESLSQALRAGFNVLRVIMIVLLAAYLLSGIFEVGTGEQGLIAQFGVLRQNPKTDSPIFGPGWHLSLPEPFENKIRIPGQTQRMTLETFVFQREARDRGKALADVAPNREVIDPKIDGSMITGDRGLAHGLFEAEFRIVDAAAFVENVGDRSSAAVPLLQRLLESAVIRVVAGLQAERVTTDRASEGEAGDAADFTRDVQRRVNADLDRMNTGLVIDKLQAQTVQPGAVRYSFIEVSNAKNEKDALESDGRNRRTAVLSEVAGAREMRDFGGKPQFQVVLDAIEAYGAAQTAGRPEEELSDLRAEIDRRLDLVGGAAARRLQEARAEANAVRQALQREEDEFLRQLESYRRSPQVTALRLWVEMRSAIMSSSANEVFFLPKHGDLEVLINRDPERAKRADIERYQTQRYN